MKRYLIAYGLTALVFLPLDFLWLRIVGQGFYRERLGDILADEFRLAPAVAFYLLYLVGVVIFAVQPALAAGSWLTALVYGALFGFFAYATYDLTNMATLRQWSWAVTVVDIAWGTVLTGFSAAVAFWLTSRWTEAG
jgi:uncharacterized membrane protein